MLGNKKFISGLSKYLAQMEKLAKKLDAPVMHFEGKSGRTPFEMLIFTMLSARTKDETTIAAAERLLHKFKDAKAIAYASEKQIAQLIKPVGFYKTKARHLRQLCHILLDNFDGKVPNTIEEITSLPGVGIKTGNIVLARAFGHDVIGVDTHVHRISNRLGLVRAKTPGQTSVLLNKGIPKKFRRKLNKIFVGFGQTVCRPVGPRCNICPLTGVCPRIGVTKHL
ncbi:MAG: endonuclease III [Candidatus Micrarchaeota archaeon]|nr:endonuclease III [Candidatus Micrarchaeota archaeon]